MLKKYPKYRHIIFGQYQTPLLSIHTKHFKWLSDFLLFSAMRTVSLSSWITCLTSRDSPSVKSHNSVKQTHYCHCGNAKHIVHLKYSSYKRIDLLKSSVLCVIVTVSTHVQHLADFVACHPGGWCQSASVQCCLFGRDGFSPPHRPVAARLFHLRAAQRWAETLAGSEQCAAREREENYATVRIFEHFHHSYLSFLTLSCMNFCRGSYHNRRTKPVGTAAQRKTLSV